MKKRFTALLLTAVFAFTALSGCDASVKADNLVDSIDKNPVPVYSNFENGEQTAAMQLAADLLKHTATGENVVLSPISVLYALAMTANGAKGETLAQMEQVFGLDIETLNNYLYSTVSTLPSDEGYDFDIANSVWVKDDEDKFVVNEEFLQTVKDYYDAGVFMAPFSDETLKDINNWVTQKTNGQIQDILDKIDPDAIMYLVNALNFEADWLNDYDEHQVRDGEFAAADGTSQTVELMYNSEYGYISDETTTGFIKYYKDKKYAFVGLLPNENIAIDEYIQSLNGEKLVNLLSDISNEEVRTAIPKYETTFDVEMSEIFKTLGMTSAFDFRTADFSGMGKAQAEGENVCINRIIHKAFIRVAEKGTQAGAATVVEMVAESAEEIIRQPKQVYLDRPFVYMIVDTQNNLPLFIGTVNKIQ